MPQPIELKQNLLEASNIKYGHDLEDLKAETNRKLGRLQIDAHSRGFLHSTGFQGGVFQILQNATSQTLKLRGELDFDVLTKSKPNLIHSDLEWLLKRQEDACKDWKAYLALKIEELNRISNFIPNPGNYLTSNEGLKRTIERVADELRADFLKYEPIESPVPQIIPSQVPNDLSFLVSVELKTILERDIEELNNIISNQAYKSTIVMAGSIIEALLLDTLSTQESNAKAAISKNDPLDRWTLENLIDAAYKLQIVNGDVENFSHSLRAYRNLIHPGKEVRMARNISVNPQTAHIAVQVLCLVICCLKESKKT